MPDAGSIPVLMSSAMKKVKEMEIEHMQHIAEVIYDPDNTCKKSVKDIKDMLGAAAQTLQALTQYMSEAKTLVSRYKSKANKMEKVPSHEWRAD